MFVSRHEASKKAPYCACAYTIVPVKQFRLQNSNMLQEEAQIIAEKLETTGFAASNGWFE